MDVNALLGFRWHGVLPQEIIVKQLGGGRALARVQHKDAVREVDAKLAFLSEATMASAHIRM
jgi:hypothetical protein